MIFKKLEPLNARDIRSVATGVVTGEMLRILFGENLSEIRVINLGMKFGSALLTELGGAELSAEQKQSMQRMRHAVWTLPKLKDDPSWGEIAFEELVVEAMLQAHNTWKVFNQHSKRSDRAIALWSLPLEFLGWQQAKRYYEIVAPIFVKLSREPDIQIVKTAYLHQAAETFHRFDCASCHKSDSTEADFLQMVQNVAKTDAGITRLSPSEQRQLGSRRWLEKHRAEDWIVESGFGDPELIMFYAEIFPDILEYGERSDLTAQLELVTP